MPKAKEDDFFKTSDYSSNCALCKVQSDSLRIEILLLQNLPYSIVEAFSIFTPEAAPSVDSQPAATY